MASQEGRGVETACGGRCLELLEEERFEKGGFLEKLEVIKKVRLNPTSLKESWVEEAGGDRGDLRGRAPPVEYVAQFILRKAAECKLVEPAILVRGGKVRYAVKMGRRLFVGKRALEMVAQALARWAEPHYSPLQIYTRLRTEMSGRARLLPSSRVNPPHLLLVENGVMDLDRFEFVDAEAVFTYEPLPAVDPVFLEELRRGKVGEECFAFRAFYRVLRKHYDEEEWERLKAVLGAALAPEAERLVALIVGRTNTRKTFLNNLLLHTLGSLAAAVSLRSVFTNRFALGHALHARVVTMAEGAEAVARHADKLKRLSEGPVPVFRKYEGKEEREGFRVIVFMDSLPRFKHADDDLLSRLVVIRAENSVEPDTEERYLIEKAFKKLSDFLEFLLWCYWQFKQNGYVVPGRGDPTYVKILCGV